MPTTTHAIPPPFTVDDLGDAGHVAESLIGLLPGIGVLLVDTEMRIRLMRGQPHTRHGLDPDSAIGCLIKNVISPRSWEAAEGQWRSALQGRNVTLDWASLDGKADYVLQFSPIRTPSGEILGAVMISEDISERWQAYRHLERRAGQQAAIAKLGSAALGGASAVQLEDEALRLLKATLGGDECEVHALDALEVAPVLGLADEGADSSTQTADDSIPLELLALVRETGRPLLTPDVAKSALPAPKTREAGVSSLAAVPIGHLTGRHGLLGITSRKLNAFTGDDLIYLETVANVLADAVVREGFEAAARHREFLLNEAQKLAGLGSWEIDLRTGEHTISEHLRDMLGLEATEVHADELVKRVHADDRTPLLRHVAAAARNGHLEGVEFRILGGDGPVRVLHAEGAAELDPDGRTVTLRGTVQDVTARREAETSLRRSEERFRKGFDTAPIGMTLIDPKTGRYLRVNDVYCRFVGRPADELLEMTYHALVHPDDLEESERFEFGEGQSEELKSESRYVRPDGSIVWGRVNASRVMGEDDNVDVLFSQVEDVTERRLRDEAVRLELDQVAWVQEINSALAEDRLELYAQPIIDLCTHEVVQRELLLRMNSRDGKVIAPGDFLPAAERYGVIRDIDRWVVARGAEIAANGMAVEINISGTSMADPTLIEEIDRALARTGVDPTNLVFEITETSMIDDVETAKRLANELRSRGCRFALDDFGTGFAGISSLKTLPLDYLKIDREFVTDLATSDTDRHVVAASIDLAHAFGLRTIAEGVEDQASLDALTELGVDFAQGYFLGRPAPLV